MKYVTEGLCDRDKGMAPRGDCQLVFEARKFSSEKVDNFLQNVHTMVISLTLREGFLSPKIVELKHPRLKRCQNA